MPTPDPFPQQIQIHPPLTPARPQPHVPAEGIAGGFADPSTRHEYDREHFHKYTTDYTNRFDRIPSLREDSESPHYESADISGGIHADVWPTYNKFSKEFDENNLEKWNKDLDVLLIFVSQWSDRQLRLELMQNVQAALFSAIVTAFLTTALSGLSPDYQQQSALLLYQLLNGRDPSLESISNPNLPFQPSASAIAVNCLWFASLSASLGASFGAMICKEWLTEYNGGANPVVDLLRACQRQLRFMAFQKWKAHTVIGLLPPLLHSSVLLFFTGAVINLWEMDVRVAIVYLVMGGIFGITYFISTLLPFVTTIPFRPYSTLLLHRLSVTIGKGVIPIVDAIAHVCFLALRYITGAILWPLAQTIFSKGALQAWYLKTRSILPAEYKPMRVWWADAFSDSLDEIDTSNWVQEEAILWLSQMPLDLSESKAVVSSLALISASRPHRFPKSVVVFLNFTLESSLREGPGKTQTGLPIDCVLVLGQIKFQSAVDGNADQDHHVGGVPVTPLVAWAAQQLTASALQEDFSTPHSEGTGARLLTAAAWLSPVDETEEVMVDGEKLQIQDRWEFLKKIKMTLEKHVCGNKQLENQVLINLIHGMHACIPRGDYGVAASTITFLPLLCEDYDSPWSEDESVLGAPITYALDLLLPPERRKPLVEREIEFSELASELIDALVVDTSHADVVAFGFWLVYRVPYAFKSRKSTLSDIVHVWTSTNEATPEDHRQRMNFHAVDAFVAVAQHHATTHGTLPKLAARSALNLLKASLEDDYIRPMATYAVAMILNLGTSTQVATFARGIAAESFTNTLKTVKSDPEKNAMDEDLVDLHIYSTLVLLKLRQPHVDVETVKRLIREVQQVIGDSVVRDSGIAKDPNPYVNADFDRVRWKAIYLSGLLFKFIPPGEWEEPMQKLREGVQALLRSGELPLAGDHEHCVEPLDVEVPGPKTPAERGEPMYTAFEGWVHEFPLFPLAGSVSVPPAVKTKQ